MLRFEEYFEVLNYHKNRPKIDQFSDGLQGQEGTEGVAPLGVAFALDLNASRGSSGEPKIGDVWDSWH